MRATRSLFRQDPARTALLRSVLSALAVGLLVRMVPDISRGIDAIDIGRLPDGFVAMYLALTAFIVFMMLSGNSWTRSSRLALGLPLSARRVWAVRTISLMAIALLSTAALMISTGITVDLTHGTVAFHSVILLTAARAAVTSVLLLFIFQLPLGDRDRIPMTAAYVVYMVFIGTLILVFSTIALASVAGTVFLLLIALLHGFFLYFRIPPTFSVGPTVDESLSHTTTTTQGTEAAGTAGWTLESGPGSRRSLQRVLFRGLKPNLLIWFLLGIVGASAAVAALEFLKGTNAFMPLFFIVIYHLPLLQGALESMTPFDPLPISRRLLWAHTVGPIVASAILGLVFALSFFVIDPKPFTQIHVSQCCLEVPWDYWEISPDGQVPSVTTAWNETFTPQAYPLWRGRTAALYNPYETGPESSRRFVDFQMHRAAQAVYGTSFPGTFSKPASEPPDGIDAEVTLEHYTADPTRGRISGDRSRTAAVALIVLSLLITGMVLPALLQYGPWVHRKLFKRASIAFLILLVTVVVAISGARLLGFTQVWYAGVLISIGLRSLSHALPLATEFLWLLCVTFWVGAYLLLGRVFSKIEFPREKTMNRFAEEY